VGLVLKWGLQRLLPLSLAPRVRLPSALPPARLFLPCPLLLVHLTPLLLLCPLVLVHLGLPLLRPTLEGPLPPPLQVLSLPLLQLPLHPLLVLFLPPPLLGICQAQAPQRRFPHRSLRLL